MTARREREHRDAGGAATLPVEPANGTIGEPRVEQLEPPGDWLRAPSREPLRLAEHYLKHRGRDDDGRLVIRRWAEKFYRYDGGAYTPVSDEKIAAELYQLLDRTVTYRKDKRNGKLIPEPISPIRTTVREVIAALPSRQLFVDDTVPCWLDGRQGPPSSELFAVRNGLLHLPRRVLIAPTPEYFTLSAAPVDWNPRPPTPERWLGFLDELWPDDDESKRELQKWFGYVLVPDTRQHKILLMVGPTRAGKGVIARALTSLIGKDNVAGPTLASLQTPFGLAPLIGTQLAIVSDMRLSNDRAAATTRPKATRRSSPSGSPRGPLEGCDRQLVGCWL